MRRAAPSAPISPRLLKHFAAATLAITTCIALFADGSTTEAVAETVKQNELKQTEVDLMGSRKVAQQGLKIRQGSPPSVEDPTMTDDTPAEGSAWDGPIIAPAYGASGSRPGTDSARPEDSLPGGELARQARKAAEPRRPSPGELAKLLEASRLRTGSASTN